MTPATSCEPSLGQTPMPDPDAFRSACAQFPTGVVVVTTAFDGKLYGSTVNAFTSLTLEPPQVLVCLAATSRTWSAIERSGVFAVNVLASDQAATAKLFASKDPDKFGYVDHVPGAVGAPLLTDTAARFECELAGTVRNNSHWMLIGRVVSLASDPTRESLLFIRGRLTG
ncbi:flavin reductase family protein [Spongiactinospora sp. TRM90649]|uniref:flavin reductase family protein n=1 Tax=Spongiactinospora sp. TRM90649 TaxID=3031114 RepID=UPI0023F72CC6|nr:flavin reductase family protein [Spongiactinospora sp. TRM90649]MDF5756356.1 flavin reductase family protein [Spongiactinospora sp. TRM90649]